MSKLSKIFENKKEIGFCSCVIKVHGKTVNTNNNEEKTKIWLDYFNDIVSDDLKVLINNEKILKVGKYLNLEKYIELSNLITNKNLNVLSDNPFDFNLEKILQNKKKNTSLRIKRNISSCKSKKKNQITFDDLIWNDKLKKYVNLQELQLIHNVKVCPKNKRNKSCLSSFNHKVNFEKGIWEVHTEQIHVNQDHKYDHLKLKKYSNEKEYNFKKKEQKKKLTTGIGLIPPELCDISEIEERIKNEIFDRSEYIKNMTMRQSNKKILLIQDETSRRTKIIANQKIEIGEVIFIEEHFLETSILFNDLWDTFNNLDDEQKKKLDDISQYMNMEKIYKRKNCENILKHVCDIHDNMRNENYKQNYYKHNFQIYNECYKNVTESDKVLKSEMYCETDIKKNRNVAFDNDDFINNLIKFEIFTDILKNSFISCNDRTKVTLFKNASFLNHSCFPNASYCFIEKNKICLLALRTINMYDEITISFINELYSSIEYRKSKLKDIKSIRCTCNRCAQVIDEERNILCSVCKYSYVSKKLNEQYIRIIEQKKENLMKEQNVNKFEYVEGPDMTNKNLSTFNFNINNEINNSEYLNKNYFIKNTMNTNSIDPYEKYENTINTNNSNIINNYENMGTTQFMHSIEPYFDLNTFRDLNTLQDIYDYKNIKENELYRKNSNKRSSEIFLKANNNTGNFFFSQFNNNTNEIETYINIKNEVAEKKNCNKICNCLSSTLTLSDNFKNPLYSTVEKKKNSCNEIKSEEYFINKAINEKIFDISILNRIINLDTSSVNIMNIQKVRGNIGYCKFHNSGKWICDTCNETISNYAMPLDSEISFIKEYKFIKEKVTSNKFDIENIVSNIEKSLLYIVGILGEKHWLYASFNHIIADLGFSLYNFNSLNKKYLLKSFNSFQNFLNYIQMKCPQATHTDLVPLVLKFLIICIYTSNYNTFYEFARSGFLDLIKQKYGSWDISYISLLYSFNMCFEQFNNNVLISRKIILMLAELAKTNMLKNHFY